MRKRFVLGLAFTVLVLIGTALPAQAKLVERPPVPSAGYIQTLALSLVPGTPAVPVPSVPDPNNPQLPTLPYVAVPPGAEPVLGALAPTTVVTCNVAYLGPLVGIVALTAALDAVPVDVPVKPSFVNPLFGLFTTACVLAPYPEITTCGPDTDIQNRLTSAPSLPAAGPVPSVDPFAFVPAPLASVVVVVQALDEALMHYVYQDTVAPRLSKTLARQLDCQYAK